MLTVTADNDGPTITDIADQTTNEDTATGAIAVHGRRRRDGGREPDGDARPRRTPTLVPLANIVLGGSGANRTVTVTPAANQSGTATITVTVSDGTLTASDTFLLTVTAVNDVPTITNIADQTITEDTATGAIGVTVGDVETAAASLTLTGDVEQPDAGAGRQHRVRRQRNRPDGDGDAGGESVRHGDDHGDGERRHADGTSDTFVLTVTAVNDGPTISDIADQTTNEDTATGAIAFTVGDVETAAASLTVSATSSQHDRWCRWRTSSSAAAAPTAR